MPLPAHDRHIPDEVYETVLERDNNACQKCGWDPTRYVRGGASRKTYIEVHHRLLHSRGGGHDIDNLVTLCNVHHDEVHRRSLDVRHSIGGSRSELSKETRLAVEP
jgi:5-methylcytosine-specific restriction endonuclease McrA